MDASMTAAVLRIPMHSRPQVWASLTSQPGDTCPVVCGAPGCGRIHALRDSLSPIVAVRYGGLGVDPTSCEHETADSGQHFACCVEHLHAVVAHCWQEHIYPAHAQRVAARVARVSERAQSGGEG